SGLIDTFLYSPIGAAVFQWFAVAPYMLEFEIAPFLGAIIIDSRTWRQISSQFKDEFLAVAQDIGLEIAGNIRSIETRAIETMSLYGLHRVTLSAAEIAQWEEFFRQGAVQTVGPVFNSQVYAEAQSILENHR